MVVYIDCDGTSFGVISSMHFGDVICMVSVSFLMSLVMYVMEWMLKHKKNTLKPRMAGANGHSQSEGHKIRFRKKTFTFPYPKIGFHTMSNMGGSCAAQQNCKFTNFTFS